MSTTKNIISTLGVVAGLGVLLVPLTSYAISDSATLPINVNVNSVIAMTIDGAEAVDGGSAEVRIFPGQVDTQTMQNNITVATNNAGGYTLSVKDFDTNNALISEAGDSIAATSGEPTTSNIGWAIQIDGGSSWHSMPKSTESAIVVKNTQSNGAVGVNVVYGVATPKDQPTGVYQDTIVYTAVTN